MLDLTALDELPTTTRIRTRPRMKKVTVNTAKRERWRMTQDELCYVAGITALQFQQWADSGILGKQLAERPNGGRARHITRHTAWVTVVVAKLIRAGLTPELAGHLAPRYLFSSAEPTRIELAPGVTIEISHEGMDLP